MPDVKKWAIRCAALFTSIPDGLSRIGVAGLYLFSLSAWISTALAYVGIFMMLFPLVLRPRIFKLAWRDLLIKLSAVFMVFLAFSTLWATWRFPGTFRYQSKEAKDLIQMGFFLVPLVAFWASGDRLHVLRAMGLALIGFMLRVGVCLSGSEMTLVFTNPLNYRLRAGMPANAFGVYASMAIVGITVMAPRFWKPLYPAKRFVLRLLLWTVMCLVLFEVMILTQSRSAWLALLSILPVLFVIRLADTWKRLTTRQKMVILVAATSGLFTTGALVGIHHKIVSQRFATGSGSLEKITRGTITGMNVHGLSMGLRVYLWKYGMENWRQRPIFGWGPGGTRYLLGQIKDPNLRALHPEGIKNFHNGLMQLLVQLGIAGVLLCCCCLYLILNSAWRAFRQGVMPFDAFLTLIGVWWLFLLATMSNIRTDDHLGQFFIYLFGGIAYAWRMRPVWEASWMTSQTHASR